MQAVGLGVGVRPAVAQRGVVVTVEERRERGEIEQPRTGGHEHANRELNRGDVVDEIKLRYQREKVAIAPKRCPWGEWHEARRERQTGVSREPRDAHEVGARVPLIEQPKNVVVDRLDGGGHEQAAGRGQGGQVTGVLEQMLDLDGRVVGDVGKRAMKRRDEPEGVADAVEEIRIAKGDVPRARGHLAADIFHHHVALDDAEAPAVDRHDGAVPAHMLAAAARLCIARRAALAVSQLEVGVAAERWKAGPVRHAELQLGERYDRLALGFGWRARAARREACVQARQSGFELAAEDGPHAEPAQEGFVHWRVKAVATQVRARVERLDPRQEGAGEARRGMHRQVDRDQRRRLDRLFFQRLNGKVDAGDRRPRLAQPSGRRRQAERLMTKVVG